MYNFSLEEYCSNFQSIIEGEDPWLGLHESSRTFLQSLRLPAVHPFCLDEDLEFLMADTPPMGRMWQHDHHSSLLDVVVTLVWQASPALLAMGELWVRLFASALAPLGIGYLLWLQVGSTSIQRNGVDKKTTRRQSWILVELSCLLSVASSVVLMTDTYYVLEYGPKHGAMLLGLSSFLSFGTCHKYGYRRIKLALMLLLVLAVFLVSYPPQFGGGPNHVPNAIHEGLYHSFNNGLVERIAHHWPLRSRTYSVEYGATPWMPTGDSRTGLPFLLNFWHDPTWTRGFVETVDNEVVALDICFPPTGHDPSKTLYMILHGLNGGSEEEYIKDLVLRRVQEGHTMVIMIARGLMDLPVKSWNVFHGARVDDAHSAATVLRRGLVDGQLLVGVGYSMGGIVMSNYVARSGPDCALDAAMSVSGGLDMRQQLYFERAKRLWQPMLVQDLREKFILGKFGERYRQRLSKHQMLELMRAVSIGAVDEHAVVTYNGYDNLTHYYSEMSALGDFPTEELRLHDNIMPRSAGGRISNVSVPFCVLHALDDPLISWRTVAANEGMMHPTNLVETGSGHLMLLLTKRGGHVGWPTGWFPHMNKWKWMSDAVKGYVDAVVQAKADMA